MPGWKKSTEQARTFSDLPPKARAYVKKIADLIGAKLSIVSIGPARSQTIRL
jgi:adenylosuccinate synthase